jgi:HEAT repeat protein
VEVLPALEREYRRPGNHSLHGPEELLGTAGDLRSAVAIPLLIEGLGDGMLTARTAAAEGLLALGAAAKPAVRAANQDESPIRREQARLVLERLGAAP